MGCCQSRQNLEQISLDSADPLIVTGGNKRLLPFKDYVRPMMDPLAAQKREEFWETEPAYSGRKEVWQTLQLACEADTIETAQAIVDSVNLIFPTGKFTDGCYDSLGNRYVIPEYCLGPLNVHPKASPVPVVEPAIVHHDIDPETMFDITARLSSGSDVSVQLSPLHNIQQLKQLVAEKAGLPSDVLDSSLVILFGKTYEPHVRVADTPIDGSALVQIMILQR